MSRRTQIILEDWQHQMLTALAKKEDKSLSQVIGEIISEKYRKTLKRSGRDPVFDLIGIGRGDGSPAAREHDKLYAARRR